MYQYLLKQRDKKGFTLVEVIVVLVILAILAAILIPSMVGWINKAQEKSAVVEGRSMLLAAQTIASENYINDKTATALGTDQVSEAETLAGVGAHFTSSVTLAGGKVTAFKMTSSDGYIVTYANATLTVTNAAAAVPPAPAE